jgi:hypothetical protein
MFLMFRLGRPDVLPVLDLGVRKGAQRIYRTRALPDAARLEKLARNWRPWASVASWYCWRALNSTISGRSHRRPSGGWRRAGDGRADGGVSQAHSRAGAGQTLFAWHERPGAFLRLSPPWDRPEVVSHVGASAMAPAWNCGCTRADSHHLAARAPRLHRQPAVPRRDARRAIHVVGAHARLRSRRSGRERARRSHRLRPAARGARRHRGGGFARGHAGPRLRLSPRRHLGDLERHAAFADRPRLRVAITGATGFIGTQLAAFLSTGGHEVVRIGRGAVRPGVVDVPGIPTRGSSTRARWRASTRWCISPGPASPSGGPTAHRRPFVTSRIERHVAAGAHLARLDAPAAGAAERLGHRRVWQPR